MSYRILSIDGGGMKGTFPCAFLAALERSLQQPIGSYFDLIVGTSTGGIIALGLGLGFSASELSEFYCTLGPRIFHGNRFRLWARHWTLSKYKQKPLRDALEAQFGNLRLGNSKTRLVIPSMDLNTGRVHIYKTAHHPHLETDYPTLAVDVALATASAPTYFPTHVSSRSIPLVDGGVWANNPTGMAVVEAIGVLAWPKDELRVLSIGCTSSIFDAGKRVKLGLGKLPWATKLVELFMCGQSSSSLGTAYVLAGHKNVFRIDTTVPSHSASLDQVKGLETLVGLGESKARENLPTLKPAFFQNSAEGFVPFHSLKVAS